MGIEIERNLDYFFKVTNLFLQGPTNAMDVINELLKYLDKDPAAKALRDYVGQGGRLEFSICKPGHAEELAEKFADNGVTFLKTHNMANGGISMFVYAEADKEKVQDILNEFRAEHGRNGIADQSVFLVYADGDVRKINNLDLAQATLMMEHAERCGIKLMVNEPGKGHFDVSYAGKDIEKMNRIKADVAIELAGIGGKALRKQINYENKNMMKILEQMNSYQKNEPTYAVDLSGQELEIGKYGIRFNGKDGVITVDRNESDFQERANAILSRMRGPISLSEEDFEKLHKTADKKAFLIQKDKENGRPVYTPEEFKEIKDVMDKKDLYELKLAMLEPEQYSYDISIDNNDMRLATFEEYNDINLEDAEKDDIICPDLLSEMEDIFHSYQEEIVSDQQVDQEFAERIMDGKEVDRNQMDNLTWEVLHDRNNNLIPDEYENYYAD